ncbi:hypothetical protein [Bradyrhizobium sp. sGM-13]|uniref:hypothetical protein n=1 Tax=Bradyrhizobium sp. sGM-13 TaxID=2831781 RepID=UPI001BCA6B4A|nr:hypothetical protein [Bradyrhizobium sp. sGM-13]
MYRVASYQSIGAVDTALWAERKDRRPSIHAPMGTYRTSIMAYASFQIFSDASEAAQANEMTHSRRTPVTGNSL